MDRSQAVENRQDQEAGPHQILNAALQEKVDITALNCLAGLCVGRIKDHGDGRPASRELSLAVTKLQEASFWMSEHVRLN